MVLACIGYRRRYILFCFRVAHFVLFLIAGPDIPRLFTRRRIVLRHFCPKTSHKIKIIERHQREAELGRQQRTFLKHNSNKCHTPAFFINLTDAPRSQGRRQNVYKTDKLVPQTRSLCIESSATSLLLVILTKLLYSFNLLEESLTKEIGKREVRGLSLNTAEIKNGYLDCTCFKANTLGTQFKIPNSSAHYNHTIT